MRSLFILGAFILTSYVTNAQSFSMIALQNSITIKVDETLKVSIALIPHDGFDQTIFLSAVPTSPFFGTIAFSDPAPNPPYSTSTLTIRPAIQDTGLRTFRLTGKNGPIQDTLTLTFTVDKNVQWTIVQLPPKIKPYSKITLKKDVSGDVCFVNYTNNYDLPDNLWIHHFRNKHWESESFSPNFNNSDADYMTYNYDRNGIFWFGTINGLATYDGTFTSLFNAQNSGFPGSSVSNIQNDKNGVQMSFVYNKSDTKQTGIVYLDGTIWKSYRPIVTNPDNEIYWRAGFCIDSSNRIWVPSIRGGIIRIQDSVQQSITVESNPPIWSNDVDKVVCDKDGDIWCMYRYSYMTIAFSHFDGTTWHHINTPTKTELFTFFIDDNKNIWAGSEEGLHKYDGTSWTTYNNTNSPLVSGVKSMIQDSNKNIWMYVNYSEKRYQAFFIFNPTGVIDVPIAPLDVEEQTVASDHIQIFPNPTSSIFTIEGLVGGSSLRLMNSLGVEVLSQNTTSDKAQIDASSLPSGLYFVSIRTATGAVVKPVIISR